jgi:hypothetical protein
MILCCEIDNLNGSNRKLQLRQIRHSSLLHRVGRDLVVKARVHSSNSVIPSKRWRGKRPGKRRENLAPSEVKGLTSTKLGPFDRFPSDLHKQLVLFEKTAGIFVSEVKFGPGAIGQLVVADGQRLRFHPRAVVTLPTKKSRAEDRQRAFDSRHGSNLAEP